MAVNGNDNNAMRPDDINLAEMGQHSTFGRTEADITTRGADKDDDVATSPVSLEQQRQNEELAAQAAEQRQLIDKQEQQLQEFANQLQRQQELMQQMQQQQQEQLRQQQAAPPATQPSVGEQQTTTPNYGQDQPAVLQSPPYSTNFVPQLQNVDPYTNYAIRRPKTVAPPTAPRSYPTSAYSPDFF